MRPLYGYSERGLPLRLEKIGVKGPNYSFIGAFDTTGILSYRVIKGGVQGTDFYIYLLEMIKTLNLEKEKTIFIFDNLRAHKFKEVYSKIKYKVNILFLPAYSPFLNPIEYWFSLLKRNLRRRTYTIIDEIMEEISIYVRDFNEDKARKIFGHCLQLIRSIIMLCLLISLKK